MQVYLRLDDDLEKWYNSLPPKGRSKAVNTVLRRGLGKESPAATKDDIARLENLIKNMSIVQVEEKLQNESFLDIPSMGVED